MSNLQRQPLPQDIVPGVEGMTFNFAMVLPGQAGSRHTHRAYFRWVDQFLVDVAGMKPTHGALRITRMCALPIGTLRASLSATQLRAWLGLLLSRGQGKQALMQARAAILTLAGLLAEAGWLDDYVPATMSRVKLPRAEEGQRPGTWLSTDQIRLLMASGRHIATSDNQLLRNNVLMTMLCTMALRREELALARWDDVSFQNNRVVLRVHGKGRKVAYIDVPKAVMVALQRWSNAVSASDHQPVGSSPLVRRIWKGGRISRFGLTPGGIWTIIDAASADAQIGHITPHDLRRSVAGTLQHAGVPIEKISRLLRHTNVSVTERYLSKLPQANEGALLMSDALGLDADDSDDPLAF
ncbi:MAG: site-specific integrase [Anaerolinea sp.]|nr:site-specific integrase [Anaerolinea sp.]